MSKTKIVLFRIKFIDLYKVPLEGLYHIVTIDGRTACSGESIEGGHTVWISKPAGTRFNVSIKDPRNGSMIDILKDLIVPLNRTTFEAHAPFAKHKFKLKMFEGSTGNYLRKTHTVTTKETLSSIAKIYGIQWQQIAQLNNLKEPYKIRPKDVLKLPPTKARQKISTNPSAQTSSKGGDLSLKTEHTVGKNETLSGISERSGVSVKELQRINGISNPRTLQEGQTIKLRDSGSAQSQVSSNSTPTPKPTSTNEDENGLLDGVIDGITSFGQSMKEGFEDFNNAINGTKEGESADSPRPFENQTDSIKSNQTYEVKSGDTLGKIAQQHAIKTNDLANANGLNLTDTIHPGDKLKIPNGSSTSSSQSQTTPTQPSIPVDTQTSDDRGQTGTPKVDVTKLGDCSCNRDLTLSELENMIRQLSGKNEIKLFDHKNCTLNTAERNTKSLLTEVNKVLKKYEINTCIRRIHFIAQLYHESASFSTTTEFSDGTQYNPGGSKNPTGKNGNTTMGDGPKYRGRGLIQLTWKNNYKLYKSYSKLDVVNNYTMIDASLAISCDVSGWFWKQGKALSKSKKWTGPGGEWPPYLKNESIDYPKQRIEEESATYGAVDMNLIADDDNTVLITYLINGGQKGIDHRKQCVKTLKTFFEYPSKCISTGVEKPKIEQASSGIAPWMEIAIREGKQWWNEPEGEIDDKDNYFKLINFISSDYDTMTKGAQAWCAAFVNYCLQETAFTKVSGTGDSFDVIRANGFRLDKVNFKKIDKPIYGAIACYMSRKNHSSHVALVIATHPNGTDFYRFGGNQSQYLSIDIRPINEYEFYVPTVYSSTAETQENAPQKSEADMKAMGVTWHGWSAGTTR